MDWIQRLLSGLVDAFKMKNPVVFTVVALILGVSYFGIESTLDATLPDGGALISEATKSVLGKIQAGLVVLLGLLGAHTPQLKSKS